MFRGINAVNLDAKGRVAIPTRYRARLAEETDAQLVVTIDTETHCLLLYPLSAWEEIEHKIESLPSFNKVTRRIQRLLIGHATEVEMDGQGRVLLPALLREYAGLSKRLMLVGQGKKFEIWDESHWEKGRSAWLDEQASEEDGQVPPELQDISL